MLGTLTKDYLVGAIAALLGNNVCTTREKLKSVFEISKKEYAQFFDCQTVFSPKVSFAFFWNSPALGCHQGGSILMKSILRALTPTL